ncbi:hypothetical protein Bcav_0081 [Beutenbergia cavernae DSM 12333]|uniref:Uncharacterized protein n=1 Tax=Beutenbergia cavernae (strain ATCC BAA-8 / DSM 12333 / CCUG 43141 / JCM 11478 / NBRC 16432 / NCIMB 13614 / HKI 0122) TaxID=471853 RepID=C5BUX2_BEUC1|nr:hypothetical protein [Beutenbergia cavernae]ACQ78346.1 hypothetical protein Bcav_0081 [Beutenbergia cavernae DSM 12333]
MTQRTHRRVGLGFGPSPGGRKWRDEVATRAAERQRAWLAELGHIDNEPAEAPHDDHDERKGPAAENPDAVTSADAIRRGAAEALRPFAAHVREKPRSANPWRILYGTPRGEELGAVLATRFAAAGLQPVDLIHEHPSAERGWGPVLVTLVQAPDGETMRFEDEDQVEHAVQWAREHATFYW